MKLDRAAERERERERDSQSEREGVLVLDKRTTSIPRIAVIMLGR
jgi:hypothetical protein